MSDDGHVPGTAGLHLAARLALLRLGEQAFTAMLDGWRAQQMTSRLSPSSPTQPPQEHQTLPAHVQTARPANSVDVEQHRGAGAGSVRTSAISGVVGGGCRHWVAGFLGAFRQEHQGADEEGPRPSPVNSTRSPAPPPNGAPPQPDEACRGRSPISAQAHAGICGQGGQPPPLATPMHVTVDAKCV